MITVAWWQLVALVLGGLVLIDGIRLFTALWSERHWHGTLQDFGLWGFRWDSNELEVTAPGDDHHKWMDTRTGEIRDGEPIHR